MLVIWVFVYSTALTNDSASFLHSFGLTKTVWSHSPWYGLAVICIMVAIASRAEKVLFRISSFMVLTKLSVVVLLGVIIAGHWSLSNIGSFPSMGYLLKQTVVMLPFTLTSILFIQTLSPMVISYRSHYASIAVARHKALRSMNIAFGVLFVTVFCYAISVSYTHLTLPTNREV